EYLSTTGEITTAYVKAMILLDPAAYGLQSELAEAFGPRVAVAAERVSDAFRTLMDFEERIKYDSRLFGWENGNSKRKQTGQHRGKSKAKASKSAEEEANRRAKERFAISIPAEVTGYDENGTGWHEAIQSVDLSRSGACILLQRRVLVVAILYLRMPMPIVLRTHEYLDQTYGTYAVVRWIRPPRD